MSLRGGWWIRLDVVLGGEAHCSDTCFRDFYPGKERSGIRHCAGMKIVHNVRWKIIQSVYRVIELERSGENCPTLILFSYARRVKSSDNIENEKILGNDSTMNSREIKEEERKL